MPSRVTLLVWCLLTAFCAVPAAEAIVFQKEHDYSLDRGETLSNQLWLAADTVTFQGTAQDDVFVYAREVAFSGDFRNDLWCMGERISVTGTVHDHARFIGASSVEISGRIGSSLMAAGTTVKIDESGHIGGDVILLGDSAICEGHAEGNVRLLATKITLAGTVEGDARLIGEDIVVLPGAVIHGDIVYTSNEELFLPGKAQHDGELIRKTIEGTETQAAGSLTASLLKQSYFFLSALLAGIVWLLLFRERTLMAAALLRRTPGRCTIAGLIALCAVPSAAFVAVFTLVGIPLAVITMAAWIVLAYAAKFVTAIYIGAFFFKQDRTLQLSQVIPVMSVGLLLLYFLGALPMLKITVLFVATTLGLGGLVFSFLSLRQIQVRVAPPNNLPPGGEYDQRFTDGDDVNHNKENSA
jgi:cytoskeletal protein CcmA (bactofilin family)